MMTYIQHGTFIKTEYNTEYLSEIKVEHSIYEEGFHQKNHKDIFNMRDNEENYLHSHVNEEELNTHLNPYI